MLDDRGQKTGGKFESAMVSILIVGVVAYVGLDLAGISLWTVLSYAAGIVVVGLLLLLARGLWILKKSGDARIEQKKAVVKAKEGRNPDDALTYHQNVERDAIAYIKQIPVIGKAFWWYQNDRQ